MRRQDARRPELGAVAAAPGRSRRTMGGSGTTSAILPEPRRTWSRAPRPTNVSASWSTWAYVVSPLISVDRSDDRPDGMGSQRREGMTADTAAITIPEHLPEPEKSTIAAGRSGGRRRSATPHPQNWRFPIDEGLLGEDLFSGRSRTGLDRVERTGDPEYRPAKSYPVLAFRSALRNDTCRAGDQWRTQPGAWAPPPRGCTGRPQRGRWIGRRDAHARARTCLRRMDDGRPVSMMAEELPASVVALPRSGGPAGPGRADPSRFELDVRGRAWGALLGVLFSSRRDGTLRTRRRVTRPWHSSIVMGPVRGQRPCLVVRLHPVKERRAGVDPRVPSILEGELRPDRVGDVEGGERALVARPRGRDPRVILWGSWLRSRMSSPCSPDRPVGGFVALFRGISEIVIAFSLRSAGKRLRAA